MNILIVDDSIDKIAKIASVIEEVSSDFSIDSVNNSYTAQKKLTTKKYDLLIVDLFLPIRFGERPIENGGQLLIKEIQRKRSLIPPTIIVGITQYEEYKTNFSSIWKLLFYNDSKWNIDLKELVEHTYRSRKHFSEDIDIKPTVFVEGKTDYIILKEAFSLFLPDYLDKIEIKTENSAGASWVANQIVIWGHSLYKKKDTKKLIKCIGLLDGDEAGNNASEEVNRVIKSDKTGASSFKIFKLRPDYSNQIIKLYQKGLIIPITLEELYSVEFWEYSEEQGWLENRKNPDLLLKDPKSWDKMSHSLSQYIDMLELSKEQLRFLKSFKLSSKEKAVNYITSLDTESKKKVLANYEKLINEIVAYLES